VHGSPVAIKQKVEEIDALSAHFPHERVRRRALLMCHH
jgi:hypothetical protein